MNTAIVSPSGSSAGIGFAVPVDTINRVVPELIEGRSPARAGLGIEALTDRGTRMLRERGVVVRNVIPGGAADRAGIRGWREEGGDLHYDVIVAVGDQPIQSFGDLRDALDPYQPGDEVSVAVRREGKLQKLKLRLQALEGEAR
jgi:S1-C subfamily serine protease